MSILAKAKTFEELCDPRMEFFQAKTKLFRRLYGEEMTDVVVETFSGKWVIYDILFNLSKPIEEAQGCALVSLPLDFFSTVDRGEITYGDTRVSVVPQISYEDYSELVGKSLNPWSDEYFTELLGGDEEAAYDAKTAAILWKGTHYRSLERAHQVLRRMYEEEIAKLRTKKLIKGMNALQHAAKARLIYEKLCQSLVGTMNLNMARFIGQENDETPEQIAARIDVAAEENKELIGKGVYGELRKQKDGTLVFEGNDEFLAQLRSGKVA